MTIGKLSEGTGVPASTIRYYERIGILPSPQRKSGQRRYPPEAMHRLAVLKLAQACGFRLEEMRLLVSGFRPGASPSERWRELATKKQQELAEQMNRLSAMQQLIHGVLRCECADLEGCGQLAASFIQVGTR